MEPKELEINKKQTDIKDIADESDEVDDGIPEVSQGIPQPAQPVQVAPSPNSCEIIIIEPSRIHISSSYLSVDIVGRILLDLLKQKDVQNIFNPKEKTKQNNYCG